MSLMIGTGPFGAQPAGSFSRDFPREGLVYLETANRWIRARFAGETVVSSLRPRVLHESGRLPVLLFPTADVRMDLLSHSEKEESHELKGRARFWSLAVGDRVAEDAVWSFDGPQLEGLIGLDWPAMDEWLEEDEPLVKHFRDPYHRIDVRNSSRHVRVSVDGQGLAQSRRAKLLYETSLPPRFYFPPEDVERALLDESDTSALCAYKGHATHWHVRLAGALKDDLAWCYREPLHDAVAVRNMIAFYNERVDLEVDGERWERPVTGWSRPPARARMGPT